MLSEAKALWLEEQRGDVEARVLQIENAAAEEARKKIEESSLQMQEVKIVILFLFLRDLKKVSHHLVKRT